MTQTTTKQEKQVENDSLLMTGEERLAIWKKAQGMWKNQKSDPIKELNKMRKEWERKIN